MQQPHAAMQEMEGGNKETLNIPLANHRALSRCQYVPSILKSTWRRRHLQNHWCNLWTSEFRVLLKCVWKWCSHRKSIQGYHVKCCWFSFRYVCMYMCLECMLWPNARILGSEWVMWQTWRREINGRDFENKSVLVLSLFVSVLVSFDIIRYVLDTVCALVLNQMSGNNERWLIRAECQMDLLAWFFTIWK